MEIDKILQLPDEQRYKILIEEVKKNKEIWLLQARPGLFAMFEDKKKQEYIPVWPSEAFAENYSKDEWSDYQSEPMKIEELRDWAKELEADDILFAAFPNNNSKAIPIKPTELLKHIYEK